MSELSGGLSSMGRGIMGMSGLDSVLSGPQTLKIIPDVRSNSLFVSGPRHEIDEVEDVLRILDASELPEQLRDRAPRYIAVNHAQVDEVAAIIRDVFKEELTPPQPIQQQRGGGGNPLAALMGAAGGGGAAQKVQMTLGIDYQNSRLYVSCSEPMFLQVSEMVEEIDAAALNARRAIRVVPLQHASSTILQQTIGSLLPRVKVSTSSTSSRSSSPPSDNNSNSNDDNQQAAEAMRQQFIQRALQGGGGLPGGGGGRTGGGTFGSPPGGSRGGSGFPGGGRTGGSRGR